MSVNKEIKRITTGYVQKLKDNKQKVSMLTAYDYTMASLLDEAGVEIILVGVSGANVCAGYESTLPISLDHMIFYAASVVRGTRRALVIADLPFGSYQGGRSEAFESAARMMKESGAHGLKLEGGNDIIDNIKVIVNAGIPVCGHLGLTPQSINKFGTFGVRAKEEAEANKLKSDALALQEAGCFAVVLEKIPAKLAQEVTELLHIPVIGIGAGDACDGQVLVVNDMLGMNADFKPKFVRRYANLHETITSAVAQYVSDVKDSSYPSKDEQY